LYFRRIINMTNGQKLTPDLLLLPQGMASLIPVAAVAVLAVVVVVFTRGRLSYGPERSARAAAVRGGAA
jgi:hypothetical protein